MEVPSRPIRRFLKIVAPCKLILATDLIIPQTEVSYEFRSIAVTNKVHIDRVFLRDRVCESCVE